MVQAYKLQKKKKRKLTRYNSNSLNTGRGVLGRTSKNEVTFDINEYSLLCDDGFRNDVRRNFFKLCVLSIIL